MHPSDRMVRQIQDVLRRTGNEYKRCQFWLEHQISYDRLGDFPVWVLLLDARTPRELAMMLHVSADGFRECAFQSTNGIIVIGDKSYRMNTSMELTAAPVGHHVGIMEDGDSVRITEYCGRCLLRTEIVPAYGDFSWASVTERTVDPSALLSWRPSALSQCAAHQSALRRFHMTVQDASGSEPSGTL